MNTNTGKGERLGRQLLWVFAGALLLYLVAYFGIEHWRVARGGWRVTFGSDSNGVPSLRVSQPHLQITNVSFLFPGAPSSRTNWQETVVFDTPLTNVPFGRVVYFDTTFLPGSIVLGVFGHQIQFLPRTLMVDGHETPWRSEQVFRLAPAAK